VAARYHATELLTFAAALLERAGLPGDRARVVAEVLVEGDLLGHTTHGLVLLPPYLTHLQDGGMARTGEPAVLADLGAAVTWDGKRLPGPWLVKRAIAEARDRVLSHPVVTMSIRSSYHIGCLAAYLKPVTDAGYIILLMCSDPAAAGVTPHGGVASRLTPNPIAAGFPTEGDPVLIDVSMSTTSNRVIKRAIERGERLPGAWLVDPLGHATDDPRVLSAEPPGATLPLGGLDLGHKGFALALIVEALTNGLCGHGRAGRPTGWTASIFLQVIDPDAFGGRASFVRETQHVADLCRSTPVAPGNPPVRLPGERGLARRRAQLRDGVELYESILPALAPWADRLDVPVPAARV
jgi:L-lactate dehydrogenase